MTTVDISTFFAHNDRVSIYRPGSCMTDAGCVLYWMQRSQRGKENQALNAAIELANTLQLPVIVLFVVTEYPAANLRHYTFMLEGLISVAHHLQQRGIPFILRRGEPAEAVTRLVQEVRAAAVIGDEAELRTPLSWRRQLKECLTVPFACVDDNVVIPMKYFPKEEWAARTIRPKIQRLLPAYLQPVVDAVPTHKLAQAPCDPGPVDNPLRYLETLTLDHSVEPSTIYKGGQDEGQRRLHVFINERLAGYASGRNQPTVDQTSTLSAYLHFGQLSVQQMAWEIEQYVPPETGSLHIDVDGGRAAFLEELIVRRELAINFALRNPHYDSLAGCPDWGRATLRKHAADPREWLYRRDELEQAKTHDPIWNAAQREMMITGRMHGYMRMYWGKKILEWTETPEEAFAYAVYLNDKYEIDGRDANGYTGIAWAIGGRHDRPWGERSIFGTVRYMSASGLKGKIDTAAYVHRWLYAQT